MKFPFASIFFLGMLFLSMTLLRCNTKSKASIEDPVGKSGNYTLKVERGAFHYYSFVLEDDTLRYLPQEKANLSNTLYNSATNRVLDSSVANRFINKIVQDGFWELNQTYKRDTICSRQLRITLQTDQQTKTVTCDDFERDCPELIKYIDQKVVELEGNGFKCIHLPG